MGGYAKRGSEITAEFAEALLAFFAIIDPVGNVLVFGVLTAGGTARQRAAVAAVSVTAAGAILIPATFFGGSVLDVLNISVESFQIAAGILLIIPAIRLVESGMPMKIAEPEPADMMMTRAFVPLATPLLAGPGAIATAVVFRETLGGVSTAGAILVILLFTAILFAAAARVVGLVGRTPVLVLAKIVGILLTAVAVQLIFRGLDALL